MLISKFTLEEFLAYLQRSTISSTDLLESSLSMAKSVVTENIPKVKQTEVEQGQLTQLKVASKTKALYVLPGMVRIQFPGFFTLIWRDGISQSPPRHIRGLYHGGSWVVFQSHGRLLGNGHL